MQYIYGNLNSNQIENLKEDMHKTIHRLLFYKEENYEYLDNYFESILLWISGFNSLFENQHNIINLMCLLQRAREEAKKENCNFKIYRKLILDSHSLIDVIGKELLEVK